MIREKAYRGYTLRTGIVIPILAILLFSGGAHALSDYGNGSWRYYREITVTENSGSTLTDYQVLVSLSGSNFPTNARSDGADIRFTDMNGTELSYWIESWDNAGKSTNIWVKVPSIPANLNTIIRMYYGSSNAITASNGDRTFDFFDDFEGTSLDETKWYINNGTPSVSDSVLGLSGQSVISEKARAFGYNYIFESLSKISNTGKEPRSFLRSTNDYAILDGSNRFEFGSWANVNEMTLINANNNVYSQVNNTEKFPISFEILGMARLTTKTEAFRQYVSKLTNINNIPNAPLYLQLYSWEGETLFVDWARIRKFSTSEPTVNTGPEIALTSIQTPTPTPALTPISTATLTKTPTPTPNFTPTPIKTTSMPAIILPTLTVTPAPTATSLPSPSPTPLTETVLIPTIPPPSPTPTSTSPAITTDVIVALIGALATIIAAYFGYQAVKKKK